MPLGPINPDVEHMVVAAMLFGPLYFFVRRMVLRLNRVLEDRATILEEVTGGQAAELRREAEEIRAAREAMLSEARREAARVRQRALEEGAALIAAAREDGVRERGEVLADGKAGIEAERLAADTELRFHVPELASVLASRIVGEPVAATTGSGR
ncbi:F0F1 ATP synthase subunit B family protein [Streptomyces longisporoflavus]|uniref:ATP synthase subunit b n=1 Tax=Streptomyces longisporoflavus TaxID=28044 RepID=A0ABW7QV70_9ACTN